jgi:glucan phosphoethanolaminetransferase (alkaline phosphatase superfamily)
MSVWRVPLAYAFLGAGFAGTTLFAQVYRYRQVSSPVQRQQTKWVVFGLAMALGGASVVALLDLVVPQDVLASLVGTISFYFFTLLIPLSIAVAVLRYHLYDIDTLINRTLVYGSVTAALVALYFVVIVVLQRGFVVLTEEKSTLAVVASTLLIAALFTPLRRRIQSSIDRRFYRRKYDARKTLEAFSLNLRDETDLDAVSDDLVGVIRETMQPAHVTLWLRHHTTSKG